MMPVRLQSGRRRLPRSLIFVLERVNPREKAVVTSSPLGTGLNPPACTDT